MIGIQKTCRKSQKLSGMQKLTGANQIRNLKKISISAPWDFTQNSKRINITQPGLEIYNVRNLLLSTNAQHQIWSDWMFQVYDKELWILFLSAIMLMILLLSVSYSQKFTWHNLLKAKMAAIKAILAQSFDQEIFLKVSK